MSSQNKRKRAADIVYFISGQKLPSDSEVRQIVDENLADNRVTPPAHIKKSLRQKIADQQLTLKLPALKNTIRMVNWAAAAILVFGISVGAYLLLSPVHPPVLQFTAISEAKPIRLVQSQQLQDKGLKITAQSGGAELTLHKAGKTHIYLNAGKVRIDVDHNSIATDVWFHTAHVTIIREGTYFTVTTTRTETLVELHEGKIGVYSASENGLRKQIIEAKSSIEFKKELPSACTGSDIAKLEKTIDDINHPPRQSPLTAEKPRRITLILKNGDSISGTITKSDANFIYIQNPRGQLKIPRNDVKEQN